mmetsp:Transcript_8150/g.13195  ORF Transcript_8150/g.13195 Transcript_8150/m.13195 type:complete len:322 (+) Transcript_8150:189-1154(+)|eukprot:CAMPEP_0184670156 /NCGR_PEP_ID=MMETSP0308-20130426/80930_1 /TAXON_ID=38269 /ORGANISM="Gloeochaete witrockiana, Strain SAG 46.84" /LENGTH=321 /DNA_ID=CAMNT_0027116783 /DNA_START=115 /DNA_END=1080 /DNA_ORIENTATION=+
MKRFLLLVALISSIEPTHASKDKELPVLTDLPDDIGVLVEIQLDVQAVPSVIRSLIESYGGIVYSFVDRHPNGVFTCRISLKAFSMIGSLGDVHIVKRLRVPYLRSYQKFLEKWISDHRIKTTPRAILTANGFTKEPFDVIGPVRSTLAMRAGGPHGHNRYLHKMRKEMKTLWSPWDYSFLKPEMTKADLRDVMLDSDLYRGETVGLEMIEHMNLSEMDPLVRTAFRLPTPNAVLNSNVVLRRPLPQHVRFVVFYPDETSIIRRRLSRAYSSMDVVFLTYKGKHGFDVWTRNNRIVFPIEEVPIELLNLHASLCGVETIRT